jgi:predicted nicotinamide N-methyase
VRHERGWQHVRSAVVDQNAVDQNAVEQDASHSDVSLDGGDPASMQVLGRYLAVQSPPLLPELRLWLVAGHVDLNARCQELLEGGYAPYWAFCWASGQALARYVLDHPALVRDKCVVDFGAGSAVVAIAAARAGAREVIAVDSDPRARRFAAQNAALNGVTLAVQTQMPAQLDLMTASDVLYEPEAARYVLAHASAGGDVLLADAHRQGTPALQVAPLCDVEARTFPDVDYPICRAFIYRLGASDRGA